MADLEHRAVAPFPKPPVLSPVVAYGAHSGVDLPAHEMRLLLDDLIEDLHALRSQVESERVAQMVDAMALGLAAAAHFITFADMVEFPGWPGDLVIRGDGRGKDGYEAMRWLANLVLRAGGMN